MFVCLLVLTGIPFFNFECYNFILFFLTGVLYAQNPHCLFTRHCANITRVLEHMKDMHIHTSTEYVNTYNIQAIQASSGQSVRKKKEIERLFVISVDLVAPQQL